VSVASAGSSLESFLDQVETRAGSTRSFKCDFRQERHLSIFPKPVIFTGQLLLERPDRLRWDFVDPIPSSLILNGRSGIKCEPHGGKMFFSLDNDPVMRLVAKQLWSWTGGTYRDLADDFDLELSAGDTLIMTPVKKSGGHFIRKINVRFDPDTLQPAQVTIEEPGEDKTVLFFSNFHINIQLPDMFFADCQISHPDNRRQ
jgi:outer membrane lipoprotein-sorting protein